VAIVMSVRGIAPLNGSSSRSVVVELIRSPPYGYRMLPVGAAGTHVRNATHAGTGRATAFDAVADRPGRAARLASATNRAAVGSGVPVSEPLHKTLDWLWTALLPRRYWGPLAARASHGQHRNITVTCSAPTTRVPQNQGPGTETEIKASAALSGRAATTASS
jgi:hypothetical protein